jgi:hypothetical protein
MTFNDCFPVYVGTSAFLGHLPAVISNTSLNPSINSRQAQHKPCPELCEGSVRDLVVRWVRAKDKGRISRFARNDKGGGNNSRA